MAAVWVLLLPLLGVLLGTYAIVAARPKLAFYGTSALMVASALLSGVVAYDMFTGAVAYTVPILPWLSVGDFVANWAVKVDVLTAVMLVVVTSVSAVVHIYSIGYMSHDAHPARFMTYLSMFTFFMLVLVTADNFLQLFVGWEGVGLCSYLLIGFWYTRASANAAAIKAFVVNRVGDFGLLLGILAAYQVFGTVEFTPLFAGLAEHGDTYLNFWGVDFHAITLICVLLLIGCMGKSAQLGLHTWLPDAMEGPTPVSALIHAATMVTAGVFLLARCSPLFEMSPFARDLVMLVGGATALFAATIGLVQNDIKRVIAYSTCSQLGYMFFACGVGAYSAAVFHLMTHAFFKALLFLGAGSVIHALDGEQDLRNMGGLRRKAPVTYAYMLLGSLALAGFPPLAGYYSKDAILEAAFANGSYAAMLAFWCGIAAAFMTAFYSFRLFFLTFHGKPRCAPEVWDHAHESPTIMLAPLAWLALGAVVSGWFGYHILGMLAPDLAFWGGALVAGPGNTVLADLHHVPTWVVVAPLALGVAGVALAWVLYLKAPALPSRIAASAPSVYRFLLNKWYFDELYDAVFVRPSKALGKVLWKTGDARIIDGLGPNGVAWFTRHLGVATGRVQTGYIYHYAFAMLIGVLVLATLALFVWVT